MSEQNSDKNDVIQSVDMAFQILETLAHAPSDLGVTALAAELGTTKSRIHRHLRTLVTLGYITQSTTSDRYRVGTRLVALGRAVSGALDLVGVAQPHMRKLRDQTGHAVSLGQLEPDGIRILSTMHGTMQIEVGVKPGSLLGLTTSAQGKVALAVGDEARLEELLAGPLPTATRHSITDAALLRAHIAEVAQTGWATAPNEAMLGLNALACPVFDATGDLAATIALVSLTEFIHSPPDLQLVRAVTEAAQGISAALGWSPSGAG